MKKRERRNDERNEETEGGKSGGVGRIILLEESIAPS